MTATPTLRPLDPAEQRFVDRFASLLATEGGMPRMPARAFACILADDGGDLTAAELAARLQVSPAAISGAVRYLVQVGLLLRARKPGARTDHYLLAHDLWYETYTQRSALLQRFEQILAEAVRDLGTTRPAAQRLEESRDFFAFLGEEMPALMERWREHRRAAGRR